MKSIPLTQGMFAIVDDGDFDYLMQWKWNYDGRYAKRGITGNKKAANMYMHAQIMQTPKGMQTDHINKNTLDNRRCNLRICTKNENMRNRGKNKNNTSGYKGVAKCGNNWVAYIIVDRKKIHIGVFKSILDAAKAYDAAAKTYHKEYSNTNF